MKDLCTYADKSNKTIILTPSDEFGLSEDKIFGIFEEMYRKPKL